MASEALRRLAARLSSNTPTFGGYSGYNGYTLEKSEVFCTQTADASGYSGYNSDPAVPAVPAAETAPGTEKPSPPNAVPTVPTVPAANDECWSEATFVAEPDRWSQPDGWGISRYQIRDLANWYEEEANHRRDGIRLDQAALDRDLRARLADRGVFPEFISVEFERVMQVVFPGSKPGARR